ncbi:MAG: tRNA (adenosine(37)-N6)-threonylcarbamoyltransferase complex dimerization subunit type 1 TsaB [Patescibacteria group bacterium]
MLVLVIRTDNPMAEVGLYSGEKKLVHETWQAHRQLAETIHIKITENLKKIGKKISDIEAVTVYQGPGSFTGLRIGISVANALSYSQKIPISSSTGENWVNDGLEKLTRESKFDPILPIYGQEPYITQQKK